MRKLAEKLTSRNWWPLDKTSSTLTFLWSVLVNFALFVVVLVVTHFSFQGMRSALIGCAIGISELFGLVMSLTNYIKFTRFSKEYSKKETHTPEEREEFEELNASVGYLFHWIAGTVVAYIFAMIPFLSNLIKVSPI